MMLISLCSFLIVSLFLYKIEREIFLCMSRRCSVDEFRRIYQSGNYSRVMIFFQINFTLVIKFLFLDEIERKEKRSQKTNISPSKFTVILKKLNKEWTKKEIVRFFQNDLNVKIEKREKEKHAKLLKNKKNSLELKK